MKEDKEGSPMVVLIRVRDLLQSIDGKIGTDYLWRFIQKEFDRTLK